MSAMKTGWAAALDAWRGDVGETHATRAARYEVFWGFYNDDVYDESVHNYAQRYKSARALYSAIKGIYNPVARLVDFYVAKVPGEFVEANQPDDVTAIGEPFPVRAADPGVPALIAQIRAWSNFEQQMSRWIRYGAALGDVVLDVVTTPRTVEIVVRHPRELTEADFDRQGRITYAEIAYPATERDADGKRVEYTYKKIVSPEAFATYRDGEPWDYGSGATTWANPFGFVPLVLTRHKLGDTAWGLNAYHHVIDKVDDVNDLASHLGAQIRKAIHPQWVSFGTKAGSGMERNDRLWHHPNPSGKVEALVEEIDIEAVTREIQSRLTEIEKDCPELKSGRVGDNNRDVSGRAVSLMLGDIIDRVTEARRQYDGALVQAQMMALRMGAQRKLWGASDFTHTIAERPVFPPDVLARLDLEIKETALEIQRLALEQQRALGTGG